MTHGKRLVILCLIIIALASFTANAQTTVPDYRIDGLYVTGDGRILAVLGSTGNLGAGGQVSYADLLDPSTLETLRRIEFPYPYSNFSINHDGSWIAYSLPYTETSFINTLTGETVSWSIRGSLIDNEALAWNPVDMRVALTLGPVTAIIPFQEDTSESVSIAAGGIVIHVDWSPNGRNIATTSACGLDDECFSHVWLENQLVGINTKPFLSLSGSFKQWSPNGDFFALYQNNEGIPQISIMRLENGEVTQTFQIPENVFGFAWNAQGTQIAIGSYGSLSIWDVATGAVLERREYPEKYVSNLAWLPIGLVHTLTNENSLFLDGVRITEPLVATPAS